MASSSQHTKTKDKEFKTGRKQPTPLFRKTVFDFPAGARVVVILRNGKEYEGKVLANPKGTKATGCVELLDVRNRKTGVLYADTRLFTDSEIDEVRLLEGYHKSKEVYVPEFNLPTFLVDSEESLNAFIKAVSDCHVKEVGVAFHGFSAGRFGDVWWILFCTENCIVPVDVLVLESNKVPVWNLLKDAIFQNESILKVFHNLRPASDYLFHKQNIDLRNVYDTQLMDFILSHKQKQMLKDEMKEPRKMITLHAALKKYLEHFVCQSDHLWVLHYFNYPHFNKKSSNPLKVRPFENYRMTKYMALTVKYLLTLKQELELVKNKNFKELFKIYTNCAVDAPYADSILNSTDGEIIMADLPNIISFCFGVKLQPDTQAVAGTGKEVEEESENRASA